MIKRQGLKLNELLVVIATIGMLTALPLAAEAIPADVVKPAVEDKVKFAFELADFREMTYEDGWVLGENRDCC